jgi:hypothetical protein
MGQISLFPHIAKYGNISKSTAPDRLLNVGVSTDIDNQGSPMTDRRNGQSSIKTLLLTKGVLV